MTADRLSITLKHACYLARLNVGNRSGFENRAANNSFVNNDRVGETRFRLSVDQGCHDWDGLIRWILATFDLPASDHAASPTS